MKKIIFFILIIFCSSRLFSQAKKEELLGTYITKNIYNKDADWLKIKKNGRYERRVMGKKRPYKVESGLWTSRNDTLSLSMGNLGIIDFVISKDTIRNTLFMNDSTYNKYYYLRKK